LVVPDQSVEFQDACPHMLRCGGPSRDIEPMQLL